MTTEQQEMTDRLSRIISTYTDQEAALEAISPETDFIKDLNINSANLVDIVLDVEQEFDIEIDNASMEKMLTVGASLEIISQKLKEKMEG